MPARGFNEQKVGFDGTSKICSSCGKRKTLSDFSPNGSGVGQVRLECRQCKAAKAKAAYRASSKFKNEKAKLGITATHRICSGCSIKKEHSEFPFWNGKQHSRCQDCVKAYNKSKAKFGSVTEFARALVEFDPVLRTKRCRGSCQKIKSLNEFGPLKAGLGGVHAKCRSCIRAYFESPKGRAIKLFEGAARRAKQKGREISITKEWIEERLISAQCEVTGIQFEMSLLEHDYKNQHPFAPSIDHKNNEHGYTPENCQLILFALNAEKSEFSFEKVKRLAQAIHNRQ